MANALYDSARAAFLRGQINWENDVFHVILVDTAVYTVNLSANSVLGDIPVGSRITSSVGLTANSVQSNGAADADDVTFTAVSGDSIETLVIYKFVTNDADSPLIAYIDTATGLPITPNGGDIIVTWDNGTNRIFRL
jgi:hypothetical protein